MANIMEAPERGHLLPRRKLGDFAVPYVTVSEDITDGVEITEHAVQDGAAVSDHARVKPVQVRLSLLAGDLEGQPLADTYRQLLDLMRKREPFDVVTGKRLFENMLISDISNTTDADHENVLAVELTLREVRIARVHRVSVPRREKHAHPGKTGATQANGKKASKETDKGDTEESDPSKMNGFEKILHGVKKTGSGIQKISKA